MRKTRTILALLLAAIMILGMFAGCAKETTKEETKKEETKKEETKKTDTKKEESKKEDTKQESAEPVKLTFMFNGGEIVPGSIGDQWVDQIEEHCNVEIEWITPAASAYTENLQLMLLDEKRPDAVIFPTDWLTSATYQDACEDGMFIDLAEYVPNYPNLLAHTAGVTWEALDIFNDGRIWGIARSTVMRADGFCVHEQWLDKLGIEYHEGDLMTMDDFFDILYAFTYDDPDGNGINDTYGLMGYSDSDGLMITRLNYIFGIDKNEFQLVDGKPVMLRFSKEYDNYKKYLAFANKCWEAGVIDPDAFAIDRNGAEERRLVSTTGVFSAYPGNMNVQIDDNCDHTYVYVPGVVEKEGDTYAYGAFGTGVYWYWGVSSTCEHPEKVLEVFDYILSDEQWTNLNAGSLEGVGFDIKADGNYDFAKTETLKAQGLDSNNPIKLIMRRSDGPEFFISKSLPIELQNRLSELIGLSFKYYKAPVDKGFVPEITKDPTFIEYMNFVVQAETKIITGEEPVDYWDEVVDGWYAAGGEQYIQEVLDYIESLG